ncbi:hypothetical protein RUND412_006411 [Rhizina undulata]
MAASTFSSSTFLTSSSSALLRNYAQGVSTKNGALRSTMPAIRLMQNRQQRRTYLFLQTVLNPTSSKPVLPTSLPSPPKTIVLLTTPHYARQLKRDDLNALSPDGSSSILAAAVDSVPGAAAAGKGLSWLISDSVLPIKLPMGQETKSITLSLPSSRLTIPLANTVFQTGTVSTLTHIAAKEKEVFVQVEAAEGLSEQEVEEFAHAQEDIREAWDELGELMKLVGQRAGLAENIETPSSQSHEAGTVTVTLFPEAIGETMKIETHIPLKPLTQPRKIAGGMGNILKTLSSSIDPSKSDGASRELEKLVPAYIDSLPLANRPEKVDIFARLTPHEPAPTKELLLQPGARIHRILSGGGGWGNKAGLLSLDPQGESEVSAFAAEFEARMNSGKMDHLGTSHGEDSVLGIVRPGEWVQFFVAQGSADPVASGIAIGCVPKSEDGFPGAEKGENQQVVLEGTFGGLAEKGVWVKADGSARLLDVPWGEVRVQV